MLESLRRGLRWGWWLAAAIVLPAGFGHLITMLRMSTLLSAHQLGVPKKEILRSQIMGTFFNQLLPTSIGGDAYQVWYLGRYIGGFADVLSSLLTARILGVVAMCLLVIVGSVLRPAWIMAIPAMRIAVPTVVLIVLCAGALLLLVKPATAEPPGDRLGLRPKWHKLATALGRYRQLPKLLGAALIYSLVLQTEIVFQYWLFSCCLGVEIGFDRLMVAVPMVTLAAMLPISLNGIGVREWVMIWICTPLGVQEADAAMMAMLFIVAGFFYAAIGAVVFAKVPSMMRTAQPCRRNE